MNREDIIRMAREVLLLDERDSPNDDGIAQFIGTLTDFAALVAAAEREAWAKFCETHIVWVSRGKRGLSEIEPEELANGGTHQGMDYAAAIRARSNT